jgi:hypothetical protein
MEDADGPVPAVIPATLLPEIMRYCLSQSEASRLAEDDKCRNVRFRAYQMVRLQHFAYTELHIALSIMAVARAFHIRHSGVTRAKLHGSKDRRAWKRHDAFSAHCETGLVERLTHGQHTIQVPHLSWHGAW